MKEVLNKFNENENNKLLNSNENLEENNLIKQESIDDDYLIQRPKAGTISDYLENYSYTYSSSFSEEEKDKSYYITIHNCKDFLIMLSLLFCSSFNFNYLYLPLILIGFLYMKFILKNTMEQRRKKSTFETIIFIYSFLLLVFKIIIIILVHRKNKFIIKHTKTFLDLGISYLFNEKIFNIIKTLIGESIILFSCICSFLIRKLFTFNNEDLAKIKNPDINMFHKKLEKYIFISFYIIIGFATFNKSVLTFLYISPFYFALLYFSLNTNKNAYFIFQSVLYCIRFILLLHILILNISNIYSIAGKYFDPENKNRKNNYLIKNWQKIGFYFAYYDDGDYTALFEDLTGYFLGCLSLVSLSFISKDIYIQNYKSDVDDEDENPFFEKEKNFIVVFFINFKNFISKPNFILHLVRIMAITWIYFFRNFFSIGIFLWIFISFLYIDIINIRFFSTIILIPSTMASLGCIHISRILNSYFSDLKEKSKTKYLHFALGDYSNDYIRFYLSNIFFSFIIFFIYSLNTNSYLEEKKDENKNIKKEIKRPLLKDIEDDDAKKPLLNGNDLIINTNEEKNEIINENINIENAQKEIINEYGNENGNENIQLKEMLRNKEDEGGDKISLSDIIKKNIFLNIDKISLVAMYFVANKEVNIIHLIFVTIFMIQLLTPQYIKKICLFIIILFQFLYLAEYIMDLLKVYCYDNFKDKDNLLKIKFILAYNIYTDKNNSDDVNIEKSLSETSIEIFIYGIIYCFYFQFQLYHNELYQNLTLNKDINLVNYIENNLVHFPIIQNILYFIGKIIIEIYIWVIISCFIFFSCYFEINLLFAIKLLIFLISVYQFCIFIQNHKFGEAKMDLKLSKILLIYSGINTFIVYAFQVLCLDYTKLKNKIEHDNEKNFIIRNLPNFGLTAYKDDNLYYNLLPHFFINFLSLLYLWEMKRMSDKFNNINKIQEEEKIKNKKIVLSNEIKEEKKKEENKKKEEDDVFNIDNNNNAEKEQEEDDDEEDEDPKMSAYQKYNSNKNKMTYLNIKYLLSMIIISFTKLYWLFLFITTCIIYTSQDISAGLFIYIFIFGITFIGMFYSIIKSLNNFIKKESYLISKVIRYYLVEKKMHIQKNKYFRSISFRYLLGYSLLLLFLLYLYGVFDLFQHGCDDEIFKGCDDSHYPIVSENERNSTTFNNTEAMFESVSYLLGFYINIREKGIMSAAWAHLLFSVLIAFDVYIQKIENFFTLCTVSNRREYRHLSNENTKLKALISSGEDNLIINIGKYINKQKEINDEISLSDSLSYNLSISRMSNINDYDGLFNDINNSLENHRINFKRKDEDLGKRYIIQFLEAFRKATTRDVSLSEKKNKYKIIRAIKEIFEEIIIFLFICNAIAKLNIWSFIYLGISIYLISVKKTMMKYYVIFCFIIFVIFIQVIIFISNIKKEIDPTPDEFILEIINKKLKIPWYKDSHKMGFFFGLGVAKSQINLIWMDFIEIVIIYIYLDYFSYSIYQDVLNKGATKKGSNRINYYNLHLDKRVNDCVRNMSQQRFLRIQGCMKYNLDIDIGDFDTFRNRILLDTKTDVQGKLKNLYLIKEESEKDNLSEKKDEDKNKTEKNITNEGDSKSDKNNIDKIKENKFLNLLIPSVKKQASDSTSSSQGDSKKEQEKVKIKMKTFLDNLYELSYLSFHNFILIIIVIISMMISGLFSLFYITFSLYFLVTSNRMYLGEKYYYPKAIKKILRVAIIVDITIQIIYQTPYFSINKKSDEDEKILIKILDIIGFNKIINYGIINEETDNFEIYSYQMGLVIAKAVTYFFMGIQILIYSSQDFQEHYLSYIITRKEYLRKISLMNAFTFNNKRIKTMNKSIKLREEMSMSMNSLQLILEGWNNKLSNIKNGNSLEGQAPSEKLNNINNENNEEDSTILNKKEIEGEKIYNKEEVRAQIKEWIMDKMLIKFEKWLYKYSVDYSKIDIDDRDIYEKDLIQGNIEVKTSLEKMVDHNLGKLELFDFTEKEMKEVKKYFDGTKLKEMKKLEKQKQIDKKKKSMLMKTKFVTKILEDMNKKETLLDDLILSEPKKEEKTEKKEEKSEEKEKKEIINIEDLEEIEEKEIEEKEEKEMEEKEKAEKEEKEEKEEEKNKNKIDLNQPKFKILEKFIKTKLFQKNLKTTYILKCILSDLITFFSKKFHYLCYLMMIINHIAMASLISIVYPLSIFCYAIFEYPRPSNKYWKFCITFSIIVLSIKCMLQLELLVTIFENKDKKDVKGNYYNSYLEFLEKLDNYKIGLKYTESTFSYEFFDYIIFDALVIILLLINNYLLINNGLWDRREQEIENIYYANDRVSKTKDLKLENSYDIKNLNYTYLSGRQNKATLLKKSNKINSGKDEDKKKISFYEKLNKAKKESDKKLTLKDIVNKTLEKKKETNDYVTIDSFNENKKNYFERLFPKIRNEKPGGDFYPFYTTFMVLIIIFIILFYTQMIQDVTFNAFSKETNQFSGSMIIFLLIHLFFLFYDRIIYINQNRKNIQYNYIIYDKRKKKAVTEEKFNEIKTNISMEYYDIKRENFIIPPSYVEKNSKRYSIVYIQKEEFNKPLLLKYIMHMFIVIFIHIFTFFYSPMKGNLNMYRTVFCPKKDDVEGEDYDDYIEYCNDFNKNWTLIAFYIIYILYFLFSGIQIKFGFYDMKRKSMLKSADSSMGGTINSTFNSIPFIYEIKLAIDWTFTTTCLDFFQWNKFESVYDTVYTTYCAMNAKNLQPVGQKVGKVSKIGMGGILSFGLIILLIIPILLFSSLNPTNKLNNLKGATLSVDLSFVYFSGLITNYTLYKNTKPESIKDLSKNDPDWKHYGYSESSNTKNFPKEQIQKVQFSNTSDRNWGLAKPHIENLIQILNFSSVNDTDLEEIQLILEYQFQREFPVEARVAGERKGYVIYNKDKDGIIKENSEIGKIRDAISKCYDTKVVFKEVYSAPIRLTANVYSKEIEDEEYIKKYDVFLGFTGCKNASDDIINDDYSINKYGNNYTYLESYFTFGNENDTSNINEKEGLIFHVFSDKVSTTTSGYSIITFYVTFILIVGTYVRNFFAGQPSKISLTEMPNCKEIINLCEGIKVARNSYDFEQEEKLYYILMEFMRSPDYLRLLTNSSVEQFNKRKKLTEKNKDN